MPPLLTARARAKLNLYLHIAGRREDGRHLLDSVVTFLESGDDLAVAPAASLTLETLGPCAAMLPDDQEKNLVLAAARRLRDHANVKAGAHIRLTKNLPVGAGLGGGSADAAATARLLRDLWGIPLDDDALARLLAPLGADIPACLLSRPARMRGIGEQLEPLPALPAFDVAVAWAGAVSTAEAYAQAAAAPLPPPTALDMTALASEGSALALLRKARNDLEPAAIALLPAVGDLLRRLRALPGCLLARMSGSGGACFGVFGEAAEAARAAEALKETGYLAWPDRTQGATQLKRRQG